MLTISEATWQAMLDEARAAIDRLNAQATGKFAKYSHSLRVEESTNGEVELVIAEQKGGWKTERRGLARRKSDGALGATRFKHIKGGYTMVPKVAPKSWDRLADKSPAQILKATKLVDFMMLHVDAVVAKPDAATVDPGPHHRIIRGNDVKIVRERPDGGWWRVTFNGQEHFGELFETLAKAEDHARDWCIKNPARPVPSGDLFDEGRER